MSSMITLKIKMEDATYRRRHVPVVDATIQLAKALAGDKDVTYTDSDGDVIVLENDEDMAAAIQQSGDCLRLSLKAEDGDLRDQHTHYINFSRYFRDVNIPEHISKHFFQTPNIMANLSSTIKSDLHRARRWIRNIINSKPQRGSRFEIAITVLCLWSLIFPSATSLFFTALIWKLIPSDCLSERMRSNFGIFKGLILLRLGVKFIFTICSILWPILLVITVYGIFKVMTIPVVQSNIRKFCQSGRRQSNMRQEINQCEEPQPISNQQMLTRRNTTNEVVLSDDLLAMVRAGVLTEQQALSMMK